MNPFTPTLTRRTFLALSAAPLAGCGGGDLISLALPGTTGTGILALASISGFGSVIVGGQTFDETAATVIIDGVSGTRGDLRLGMTVKVNGTCAADGTTCAASRIEAWRTASGLVTSVGAGHCTVNGSTFSWDAATLWDGTSATTLSAGTPVLIWAFQADASATHWQVTRLTQVTAQIAAQPPVLTGLLESRQGNWYVGSIWLRQLPSTLQVPGRLTWVQGQLADLGTTQWTVTDAHVAALLPADTADKAVVLIEGLVTGDVLNGQLQVGAQTLDVSTLSMPPKQGQRVRMSMLTQPDGRLHVDRFSTNDPDEASHQTVRLSGRVEDWFGLDNFSIQGQRCNATAATGDVQALTNGAWVAVTGLRTGTVLSVQTVSASVATSRER